MGRLGFHTRGRKVAGLHAEERNLTTRVWCGDGEAGGGFIFILAYAGATVDVLTTRAGIEAIRDACNDALVRTDD
jgi:hypothetical protein